MPVASVHQDYPFPRSVGQVRGTRKVAVAEAKPSAHARDATTHGHLGFCRILTNALHPLGSVDVKHQPMTAHQSLYLESSARLVADARLSRRGIAACHRAILSP